MKDLLTKFLSATRIPHPRNRAIVMCGVAKDMTRDELKRARRALKSRAAKRLSKLRELGAPPVIMSHETENADALVRIADRMLAQKK